MAGSAGEVKQPVTSSASGKQRRPVVRSKRSPTKPHIVYHKDGSVWAKGSKAGETMVGYWEWFRKDGTKLRSGYFEAGTQVGRWTTYDKKGIIYKITEMKSPNRRSKA
jgi:hypothetical protein